MAGLGSAGGMAGTRRGELRALLAGRASLAALARVARAWRPAARPALTLARNALTLLELGWGVPGRQAAGAHGEPALTVAATTATASTAASCPPCLVAALNPLTLARLALGWMAVSFMRVC